MKRRDFIRAIGLTVAAAPVRRVRAQAASEADFVVVGAGSAGCALVYGLTADPDARVVLLEAGSDAFGDPAVATPGRWTSLLGSARDWGYETEPEPGMDGRRLAFPRGKAVGGCSAINAMTYVRGHRLDFDGWRRAGNDGWGYDDVLPVFRQVEDNSRGASPYRGAGGPLRVADGLDPHAGHEAFLAAAQSLGYRADPAWEFNAPEPENGAGFYQKNIRDGRRHSAADAFLPPARARGNLEVIAGAHATRVLFEGRRAVGVEYLRAGRREQVRARREVILCGGVIDSPRLLMLSGVGPADHLRAMGIAVLADLPGVGANLQDHLKLSIRWNGRTTLPPSTVTAGLFVRSQPGGVETAARTPNLQFYVGRGVDQPDRFITITVSLVRPHSRGEVRLRSADPFASPVIRANYLREAADVDALVDGVHLARTLGGAAPYEKLRGDELEPGPAVSSRAQIAAFARRAADTIYHPAGTCAMGDGIQSVVDARLAVHGVEGLRVADASVMPDVVNATTHAACVMIGARAAGFAGRQTRR